MPLEFRLDSGLNAYAVPGQPISDLSFGARYVSYNNVNRFLSDDIADDLGLIVWPGGTLAETRSDRYGFEFEDLYNPATNKPGLSEMMEAAIDLGTGLSVILPTARYAGDPGVLRTDLQDFVADLLGGSFGPLPDPFILEIGSEYFGNFGGPSKASDYGVIAELMITEIARALADPSINTTGADVTVAVQAGKTMTDDILIRDELSNYALANVDMIIHHRFAFQPQGVDRRIPELEEIAEAWAADTTGAGGEDPELFVSAWNTVTLTRNEALADYIAEQGGAVTAADIDLEGRTTTDFERFWQDRLDEAAYGQEHAAYVLESFASYAEAGMAAGAVYGIDTIHPGHLSWQEHGEQFTFVGGEMLEMIYESVGGTNVLASDGPYDTDAPATVYGFENADKLVVFVAAGENAPGDVVLDLDGLTTDFLSLRAERLTSETPQDWMEIFGIADNPMVDEGPEADAYAVGHREAMSPDVSPDGIAFSLSGSHDIVRLVLAKTVAGEQEIAEWAEGTPIDLVGLPQVPVSEVPAEDEDAAEDDVAGLMAEAAGAGGGLGMLLAMLFFFV